MISERNLKQDLHPKKKEEDLKFEDEKVEEDRVIFTCKKQSGIYGLKKPFMKKIQKLSWIIAILTAVASLGALFIPNLYKDPIYLISQAWGQDVITAFIVVPLQFMAIQKTMGFDQSAIRWFMVWAGCLLYEFYTYMLYIFLASFNKFFLLYMVIAGLSFYLLLAMLTHLDYSKRSSLLKCFDMKEPTRKIEIFLSVVVIMFYFIWGATIVPAMISGVIPEGISLYNQHAVFAMDYVFLLPLLGLAARKLHQESLLGYILTGVVMIKVCTLGLAIVFMAIFMIIWEQSTDMGLLVIFSLITIISSWLTYKYYKKQVM